MIVLLIQLSAAAVSIGAILSTSDLAPRRVFALARRPLHLKGRQHIAERLVPAPATFPVRGDCVVELVGLEPTTRVLWNAGVSDQLTLSNTRLTAASPR